MFDYIQSLFKKEPVFPVESKGKEFNFGTEDPNVLDVSAGELIVLEEGDNERE